MTVLSKGVQRFSTTPIKLSMVISTEKVIKKNCMEIQKDPKIAKAILRKKIRDGTVRLPD